MLARLDEIHGVAESRVDWTGKRFLLVLEKGAGNDAVEEQAVEVLGETARPLTEDEVRAALESYREGEAWMRAGDTLQLSRFEAGVLAKRYGSEVSAEIGLNDRDMGKLVDLFEEELIRAFERMHAGEGIAALPGEFEAASRRILEASARFMTREQRGELAGYLRRFADSQTR